MLSWSRLLWSIGRSCPCCGRPRRSRPQLCICPMMECRYGLFRRCLPIHCLAFDGTSTKSQVLARLLPRSYMSSMSSKYTEQPCRICSWPINFALSSDSHWKLLLLRLLHFRSLTIQSTTAIDRRCRLQHLYLLKLRKGHIRLLKSTFRGLFCSHRIWAFEYLRNIFLNVVGLSLDPLFQKEFRAINR